MKSAGKKAVRALSALGLVAAGIASIIGSGGGGGGGSSSVASVAITTDNAQGVASVVVQAVGVTFDLASVTGGQVSPGVNGAGSAVGISAVRRALALLSRARIQGLTVQPALAFGPDTVPCDVSGSVTLSGDLADPYTLTVGDRITARFSDCHDNDPFVLDGRLDLVVRAIQGDPQTDVSLLTLDLTLIRLSVTENTETFTGDGDFTLTLNSLDFPVTLSRIVGSRLELGSSQDVDTLTDFDHSLELDAAVIPNTRFAEAVGTLASELLGGKVDYQTVTPVHAAGEDDPDTGEILVTGADSTTIHIVIVDSANVRLDIDVDGNGSVDESQDTTWAALNGPT